MLGNDAGRWKSDCQGGLECQAQEVLQLALPSQAC